jgi:hypothetical protein
MEGGICTEEEGEAKGREGYAEKGRLMAGWKVILGLENVVFILTFFLSVGWLNRFGSVSDFRNRNQTEPEFLCDFLIG